MANFHLAVWEAAARGSPDAPTAWRFIFGFKLTECSQLVQVLPAYPHSSFSYHLKCYSSTILLGLSSALWLAQYRFGRERISRTGW